jgi:hypothetical protein
VTLVLEESDELYALPPLLYLVPLTYRIEATRSILTATRDHTVLKSAGLTLDTPRRSIWCPKNENVRPFLMVC